jgi:hypothetical protein
MRKFVPDGSNYDEMMSKALESFRKYRIRKKKRKSWAVLTCPDFSFKFLLKDRLRGEMSREITGCHWKSADKGGVTVAGT